MLRAATCAAPLFIVPSLVCLSVSFFIVLSVCCCLVFYTNICFIVLCEDVFILLLYDTQCY